MCRTIKTTPPPPKSTNVHVNRIANAMHCTTTTPRRFPGGRQLLIKWGHKDQPDSFFFLSSVQDVVAIYQIMPQTQSRIGSSIISDRNFSIKNGPRTTTNTKIITMLELFLDTPFPILIALVLFILYFRYALVLFFLILLFAFCSHLILILFDPVSRPWLWPLLIIPHLLNHPLRKR